MPNFNRFLKSKSILLWFLLAAIGSLLLFSAASSTSLRIPLSETTRRKFRLYEGVGVELFQGVSVEQTIVANYPGLNQIDILILGSDQRQTLTFRLKQNCDGSVAIVNSTAELPPQNRSFFQAFTFPPLDDSAGQSYCIILEAPEATSERPVKLPTSQGDLYPYGRVVVNNPVIAEDKQISSSPKATSVPGADLSYKVFLPIVLSKSKAARILLEDLGFLLHYRGSAGPTTQHFVARLTANKPNIWKQAWFYGGLILSYIVLLTALFLLVWRMIQADLQE